jgi:hypothetical protein
LRPRPALAPGEIVTDVLVLNFTYEALNITSFQRAVKLLFSGKAEMVHRRDDVIKSTSYEMRLPSIIRMLYYIKRPMQKVALTKKNVLLRDDYTCQYCAVKGERMMTAEEQRRAVDLGEPRLRVHALQQPQEQPHARAREHAAQAQAEVTEVHPLDPRQAQHAPGRVAPVPVPL